MQVLGSFRLDAAQAQLLAQLNQWTRCCELSVAASIQDCFDPQLEEALAPPA